MPPEKLPPKRNGDNDLTRLIVESYLGFVRFVLMVIPLVCVLLIGASYAWDVERGAGCDALQHMLSFMTKVAIGYGSLFVVCVVVIPKILIALRGSQKE